MTSDNLASRATPAQGFWSFLFERLAYGVGTLAFLLAPLLIPGTSFTEAVVESVGVALVGTPVLLGIYTIYGAIHKQKPSRRARALPAR